MYHVFFICSSVDRRLGCFCVLAVVNGAVLCLVAQSCLTFCDLIDCSPPGFSVHGDSPGKNAGVRSSCFGFAFVGCLLFCFLPRELPLASFVGWLCLVPKLSLTLVTPWIVACQAPLSVVFPRQEYWSRLPFPSPGDLPDPGIEPASLALAGRFFTIEPRTLT